MTQIVENMTMRWLIFAAAAAAVLLVLVLVVADLAW